MPEKRAILVIEDDHAISNFICRALTANDYKAIPAASGKEGLSLFFSHSPDLVLLDLGLPDMDGLEVLEQFSDLPQEVPTIIISARDRESEKVKALDMGADDYVVKPFGASELLARIRTTLRRADRIKVSQGIQRDVYQVKDLVVDISKHQVTLGGQLIHADFASFKWPLQDFKDFLIRQCYKKGVDIKLNTEATKDMLAQEHYDHVIVAIGPVFTKANIPGAQSDKVLTCMDVFGHEDELPHNIVVIGGSETGVETAMDLAEKGHKVTVLCRQKSLASDAPHAHYVTMLEDAWLKLDNFYWVKGIEKYLSIDDSGVSYVNFEGKEKRIDCDCVIMCTGARPNTEGCTALYGAADRTDFVGDCFRVGNVHFAVTTAFGAANQI